jgi:hypothetical protein
VDRVRRRNT